MPRRLALVTDCRLLFPMYLVSIPGGKATFSNPKIKNPNKRYGAISVVRVISAFR
jgi:hypothetical protein